MVSFGTAVMAAFTLGHTRIKVHLITAWDAVKPFTSYGYLGYQASGSLEHPLTAALALRAAGGDQFMDRFLHSDSSCVILRSVKSS